MARPRGKPPAAPRPRGKRGKVARAISVQEAKQMTLQALIVGPVRALNLLKRVPEYFKQRGWPSNTDHFVVAVAAIGNVALGARGQVWRLPAGPDLDEKWAELRQCKDGKPTAMEIVTTLGLERFLEPA